MPKLATVMAITATATDVAQAVGAPIGGFLGSRPSMSQ
jgi:predicted MFS family arabinose efflux permease